MAGVLGFSVAGEITAPYSKIESWMYDFFVAPAIASFYDAMNAKLGLASATGQELLDVGCGGGHLLVYAAGMRPDLRVTGLDLSREQVARAKRRLAHVSSRASVRQGSVLDLPFADGSFDVVTSVGSIKHWPDQARGLAECARVLAPGGRLLIVEADRGCRLPDVDNLFSATRFPRPFRLAFRAAFRLGVSGPSLDLDDLRSLAAGLPLESCHVYRMEGLPAVVLDGIKEPAAE